MSNRDVLAFFGLDWHDNNGWMDEYTQKARHKERGGCLYSRKYSGSTPWPFPLNVCASKLFFKISFHHYVFSLHQQSEENGFQEKTTSSNRHQEIDWLTDWLIDWLMPGGCIRLMNEWMNLLADSLLRKWNCESITQSSIPLLII